jgi:hypothetical protein
MLNDPFMNRTMTQSSHQKNVSIIFTSQNYYEKSSTKTIIRQCNYKVFFNMEKALLSKIGGQIEPVKPSMLVDCFQMLQKAFPRDKHRYILIDTDNESAMPQFGVRSKIFPDPDGEIRPLVFFVNRSYKKMKY